VLATKLRAGTPGQAVAEQPGLVFRTAAQLAASMDVGGAEQCARRFQPWRSILTEIFLQSLTVLVTKY
jgi:hypothetical protein